MPTPDLVAFARAAATKHALDPPLVCAVIEQESAWDRHAIRYEPGFRTRYVAPLGLPPKEGPPGRRLVEPGGTEEIARSISWGLMQVMGQVAREHGFDGKFLSALCDPALGLDIGCAVLAAKLTISRGPVVSGAEPSSSLFPGGHDGSDRQGKGSALSEIEHALQLWNGGSNPNYAAQVLARLAHYK
jgi:Transglycosylase SLT domain